MRGRNEFRLCQAEMLEAMQQYFERTVMQKEYFAGAKIVDVKIDAGVTKGWVVEIEQEKALGPAAGSTPASFPGMEKSA